jgi:putative hydrolase of the HAD superfamily
MKPQIRACLLDLDDTLIDDTWAMQCAARSLAANFEVPGCETSEQVVDRWAVLTQLNWRRFRNGELSLLEQRRERVRGLLQRQLNDPQADEVFASYMAQYQRNWRLVSGATEFLGRTESMPRVIVSNGERSQVHRKLLALGIQGHFVAVVTPEDAKVPKPNPGIFLQALEILGLKPHHCLMIGDDFEADIEPAQRLGMSTFHVIRGTAGRELVDAVPVA